MACSRVDFTFTFTFNVPATVHQLHACACVNLCYRSKSVLYAVVYVFCNMVSREPYRAICSDGREIQQTWERNVTREEGRDTFVTTAK
jgi:hypothetical protein